VTRCARAASRREFLGAASLALGGAALGLGCDGAAAPPAAAVAAPGGAVRGLDLEKDRLKLGFIKLTDCVPIIVARELGFFREEGLTVEVEAQANWKILLDRVIGGELDGAHMLAGQPIGATIGVGTQAPVVSAFSMDLNGNAITVSNALWKRMQEIDDRLKGPRPRRPVTAESLVPIAREFKEAGNALKMGMVFPVSTHNYELRYWLAAGGVHPGFYTPTDTRGVDQADLLISVTPPPQMPATLEAGTIHGYCVGEPWNQQAVFRGIGVPVITDYEIWKNNPEKVFGVTAEWAARHPRTHVAVVKALIRAGKWLDASIANRRRACEILSRRENVGADVEVIANSMTGTFEYEKGDKRELPDFNVFFRHFATYPYTSDCVWTLTQMRRWGQIPESRPDAWYFETARKVYRPDVYLEAAGELIREGLLSADEVPRTDGFKPPTRDFIDGMEYDGRKPNAYLAGFKIGLK